MGIRIEDFADKWGSFKASGRPRNISRGYFPDAESIKHASIAAKFPSEEIDLFPYTGDAPLTPAAFSYWVNSGILPEVRVRGFETLTNISLRDWQRPAPDFEKFVRRRAGEIQGWKDLLEDAVNGGIEIEVRRHVAELMFQPIDIIDEERGPTEAWPGCRARVWLPKMDPPADEEQRHAWLIADYGAEIFVLDPMRQPDSVPTKTRLTPKIRALPRNKEEAVGLSARFPLGQLFDIFVLTFDFDPEPDVIAQAFRGLEARLVNAGPAGVVSTYRNIRDVLDEAATLIGEQDLEYSLYHQQCVVVGMPAKEAEA